MKPNFIGLTVFARVEVIDSSIWANLSRKVYKLPVFVTQIVMLPGYSEVKKVTILGQLCLITKNFAF